MKPAAFAYERPGTVDETLRLLAGPAGRVAVLAGGQSLVRLLNLRQVRPEVVVDLNRVDGLDRVEIGPDAVRIGAMVRLRHLRAHPDLRRVLPILAEAAGLVAYPQIRNRSTVGGCLCHADPVAELPTVAVALDASVHLRSASGVRVVPAGEFLTGAHTTTRRPDELVTAVDFPRYAGMCFAYEEVSRRGNDATVVGACLGMATERGAVTAARVAAGGIGDRPRRLPAVERALVGYPLTAPVPRAVVADAGTDGYRHALLLTVIRRAVARLADQSGVPPAERTADEQR